MQQTNAYYIMAVYHSATHWPRPMTRRCVSCQDAYTCLIDTCCAKLSVVYPTYFLLSCELVLQGNELSI